jgi:hypothetical protein
MLQIVHVEIFLGEGDTTVGARSHKGRVQVLPSYLYTSANYIVTATHFRSLETWLDGDCYSRCAEHPWQEPAAPVLGSR